MAGKKLYTPDEAKNYFPGGKVSRHNIYNALKTGALEHIVMGRRILITEEALDKWIESLTVKAS